MYVKAAPGFIDHQTMAHSQGEYVRIVHTNTIEGYFSVFKRGMKGVYQHCGKQHLHRYLLSSISVTTIAVSSAARTQSARIERCMAW